MTKNILITGGNSGIGKEMARGLAGQGHRVIVASRDLAKSQAAAADIMNGNADAQVEAMALDLGDFAAVDRFAADLLERMPVIDVLILNAGLYTHGVRALANGLESMIGVMHFGHFRLTQQLAAAVCAAPAGRIVVTSSNMHKIGRIREETFDRPDAHFMAWQGYGQAKLANILFTRELARRLANQDVTVNCFHPGPVATGIWEEVPRFIHRVIRLALISPKKGADTGIWLASADKARQYSGEYFVKRRIAWTSAASRDAQLADWLWQDSEARLAKYAANKTDSQHAQQTHERGENLESEPGSNH